MDFGLPGSSVHEISQARILEWIAISSSRGSSWLRDRTCVSCNGRWILYHWATREAHQTQECLQSYSHKMQACGVKTSLKMKVKSLSHVQLFATPWTLASVQVILQERILEWVAISFSRESSQLRDQTQVSRIVGRCFNLWATKEARPKTSLVQLITQTKFCRGSRYNTTHWVQQALDPDLLTALSDSPHKSLFLTLTFWRCPKDK